MTDRVTTRRPSRLSVALRVIRTNQVCYGGTFVSRPLKIAPNHGGANGLKTNKSIFFREEGYEKN